MEGSKRSTDDWELVDFLAGKTSLMPQLLVSLDLKGSATEKEFRVALECQTSVVLLLLARQVTSGVCFDDHTYHVPPPKLLTAGPAPDQAPIPPPLLPSVEEEPTPVPLTLSKLRVKCIRLAETFDDSEREMLSATIGFHKDSLGSAIGRANREQLLVLKEHMEDLIIHDTEEIRRKSTTKSKSHFGCPDPYRPSRGPAVPM